MTGKTSWNIKNIQYIRLNTTKVLLLHLTPQQFHVGGNYTCSKKRQCEHFGELRTPSVVIVRLKKQRNKDTEEQRSPEVPWKKKNVTLKYKRKISKNFTKIQISSKIFFKNSHSFSNVLLRFGKKTWPNFRPTAYRSRFTVSKIGSSKVSKSLSADGWATLRGAAPAISPRRSVNWFCFVWDSS